MTPITKDFIDRYDAILARGLSKGLGSREIGEQVCIEAAVCYALDLPHNDDPKCVDYAVRAFKIRINDANWSSPMARARGLRNLGIAQIGTLGIIDSNVFVKKLVHKITTILIPDLQTGYGAAAAAAAATVTAYTAAAAAADVAADAYAAAAAAAAAATVTAYAAVAAAAAAAAATVTAYAAVAAAYADAAADAYAADAAAAAAAVAAADVAGDYYLIMAANLAYDVLKEMNAPAFQEGWVS